MSQRTTGIYRLTQISRVYALFQWMLGGERGRARMVAENMRPVPGSRVLDLGCGPAAVLPLLGKVEYVGIDANPDHIQQAIEAHGGAGQFICGDFASLTEQRAGGFDLVLCLGLLHHLDDERVTELAELAKKYLAPGGRLFTVDPVFEKGQHPVARWLAAGDSGQNVREARGYRDLVGAVFEDCSTVVRHDLLNFPYSHCIMTATTP